MKYQIKKKQVLEAIASEPLAPGMFIDVDRNPNCNVCAVGAVLRSELGKKLTSDHGYAVCTDGYSVKSDLELKGIYQSENFLSILSCEFETAAHETEDDMDFCRFHALMVAEGMCPDTLEFEIKKDDLWDYL